MENRKEEYITNEDNTVRYVLGKYNKNPLCVFGINPSIATAEKNDNTISIVENIAELRKCDGYLMFNIYPFRATKIDKDFPNTLQEKIVTDNVNYIEQRIIEGMEVVAAWGTHIEDREFFINALEAINKVVLKKKAKWICLSKTNKGHPHHPTRLAYNSMSFEEFDMNTYIEKIKKKI